MMSDTFISIQFFEGVVMRKIQKTTDALRRSLVKFKGLLQGSHSQTPNHSGEAYKIRKRRRREKKKKLNRHSTKKGRN